MVTAFSDLIVVQPDGRYLGILSEGDLLRTLMPDLGAMPDVQPTLRRCFAALWLPAWSTLSSRSADL